MINPTQNSLNFSYQKEKKKGYLLGLEDYFILIFVEIKSEFNNILSKLRKLECSFFFRKQVVVVKNSPHSTFRSISKKHINT